MRACGTISALDPIRRESLLAGHLRSQLSICAEKSATCKMAAGQYRPCVTA